MLYCSPIYCSTVSGQRPVARYHEDYKITPQELKYLARCVELLKEQTETSCETKMGSFV